MTDPKQGQGQLAAATEIMLRSMTALPDGVIVIGPDRRIVFANGEAGSILGTTVKDLAGLDLGRLFNLGDYDWGDALEAAADGVNGEFIIRGGTRGSVFATVRRVTGVDGAMLLCLRDLEVFDHMRRSATGLPNPAESPGTVRKVRPNFARQRQISPYLDRIIARGERALVQGARVIITGESGVGKTEIARHLHHFVSDASDPFIVVNCAAIPDTLFESELFGYEKGAFTGALSGGKPGLIEQAEGGTLFLDEVGEIPVHLQAKLLSFLEDGTVQRVGGAKPKQVHVRVISATNRDLEEMAADRLFRRDLYYRLAVVRLPIKSLRETPELIVHLVDRFLASINQRRPAPLELSEDLRSRLLAYDYPGNIRELYNLMQQISVLAEEDELPRRLNRRARRDPDSQRQMTTASVEDGRGLKDIVAEFERGVIEAAIAKYGSKRKAAAALDVDIGTIVRKTKNVPSESELTQE
ncbi:sigma-54 interaction domain-containing protein [Oricola nitratireducens]|uniref:sigma-54 interaction domain-containing protein n=1 Tax=Oricola nitratireducens TaxID=2775868 RepID=UPI001865BC5E|nr:sigma 54-interacting transcriptional regulator [Oricola nitratireducens]